MIAEIDFKEAKDIKSITFSYIQNQRAWILPPKAVTVYTRKADGSYELVFEGDLKNLLNIADNNKSDVHVDIEAKNIVALKIHVENYQKLPSSHPYAGNDCWLFVDELVIE